MDEMDRDVQAIWRWINFLGRQGHVGWDPETTAEAVGAYVRDAIVQREIGNWRYAEIDGLGAPEEPKP